MDLHVRAYPRPDYIFHVSSKSVQGFGAPWGQNLAFPITLASRFYNSLYYRTSRDSIFPEVNKALCSHLRRKSWAFVVSQVAPLNLAPDKAPPKTTQIDSDIQTRATSSIAFDPPCNYRYSTLLLYNTQQDNYDLWHSDDHKQLECRFIHRESKKLSLLIINLSKLKFFH